MKKWAKIVAAWLRSMLLFLVGVGAIIGYVLVAIAIAVAPIVIILVAIKYLFFR